MVYLKSYNLRHAFSVSLALVIAALVSYFFSFSQEGWIILTAFLIGQTTRGTPLRRAFIFFLVIILALIVSVFLQKIFQQSITIYCLLAGLFLVNGVLFFLNRPLINENSFLLMIFTIILFIATFLPEKTDLAIQARVIDVAIGSVIGVLCGQLLFPINLAAEFRRGVIPLLNALIEYSNVLAQNFMQQKNYLLDNKKVQIEKALLVDVYPEWVYDRGFNPGLRAGFRFFLINLEQLTEIFFSLNYWSTRDKELDLTKLTEKIADSMQKNAELLTILKTYFTSNELHSTQSDFTTDIKELETGLQSLVPANLEFLDIALDYVSLTACVRDIKDMRQKLLQLVFALPSNVNVVQDNNSIDQV